MFTSQLANCHLNLTLSCEEIFLKLFGHSVVIVMMLLTFMGQALSSITPCDMSEHQIMMSSSMNHDMASMDHEMGSMTHDKMDMECCDTDCQCPTGACVSFVLLPMSGYLQHSNLDVERIQSPEQPLSSYQHKSLYRPPIFA